jgi:predicted ATPase
VLKSLRIQNFKSIEDLSIELGRVTVLIGANGSGKSNILEAVAFAGAAAADKLDHEFLASRGIRVPSDPSLMRSAFSARAVVQPVTIRFSDSQIGHFDIELSQGSSKPTSPWVVGIYSNAAYRVVFNAQWLIQGFHSPNNYDLTIARMLGRHGHGAELKHKVADEEELLSNLRRNVGPLIDQEWGENKQSQILKTLVAVLAGGDVNALTAPDSQGLPEDLRQHLMFAYFQPQVSRFLVYSPDYTTLRTFTEEGQILPLGVRGEGLFSYVREIITGRPDKWTEIKSMLCAFDWFGDLSIPGDAASFERRLEIRDRFLDPTLASIDQRSTSEGFLYLLFLACLLAGKETPPFFAVDNVDTSFNPKLCRRLATELVRLATKYDKQAILTTHNPAILDGLNLHDADIKLYTISRNENGRTQARKVEPPRVRPGQAPVPLSEAFLRGYLGGLPDNF